MKNFILSLMVFGLFVSLIPSLGYAGTAVPVSPELASTKSLNKKELRKQKRSERVANFIQKRVEKRMEKIQKKRERKGFGDLDRNLQLALIFGVAAVVLSILGTFIPFLWVLSGLAWLVGVVFLVLWLIENV